MALLRRHSTVSRDFQLGGPREAPGNEDFPGPSGWQSRCCEQGWVDEPFLCPAVGEVEQRLRDECPRAEQAALRVPQGVSGKVQGLVSPSPGQGRRRRRVNGDFHCVPFGKNAYQMPAVITSDRAVRWFPFLFLRSRKGRRWESVRSSASAK